MRLTRRGWGVLGVGVVGFLLAWQFGARSLNAVVAPAFVALLVGVVTLARRDAPTVTRRTPTPGFPGEIRSVERRVTADGPCRLAEESTDGLRPLAEEVWVAGDSTATLDVELVARGEHHLGPATVTARDPLGLVERETRVTGRTPVLVYPRVDPITPNRTLSGLVEQMGITDREAFDSLREYVPGDPLRDVHWRSSAKRPDDELVVTEFATQDEGSVTIAAEADAGRADEMAAAAASLAVHLLDAGVSVELYAPGGHVPGARGEGQRDRVLELLARTPAGRVPDRGDPDVRISATERGVTVATGRRQFPFDDLSSDPPAGGEVAA